MSVLVERMENGKDFAMYFYLRFYLEPLPSNFLGQCIYSFSNQ